jgi:hypothetical protein
MYTFYFDALLRPWEASASRPSCGRSCGFPQTGAAQASHCQLKIPWAEQKAKVLLKFCLHSILFGVHGLKFAENFICFFNSATGLLTWVKLFHSWVQINDLQCGPNP